MKGRTLSATLMDNQLAGSDAEARDSVTARLLLSYTVFAILWFAVWTATVNVLVLTGTRFPVLPWCLATTTVLSSIIARAMLPRLIVQYAQVDKAKYRASEPPKKANIVMLLAIACAGVLAFHFTQSTVVLIVVTTAVSALSYFTVRPSAADVVDGRRHLAQDFALVCIVVFCLYYFGHKPDGDDANYLNLAAKLPLTRGQVFQFDTMVGDGPHPIHLPTYRLQTYEILGGTIAYVTGLEPIQVFHLLLPIATLSLLACILPLVLLPALGRHWVAASSFAFAFFLCRHRDLH